MTNETFREIERLETDLWEAADDLPANSKPAAPRTGAVDCFERSICGGDCSVDEGGVDDATR